jgi:hypothetical protein
MRVVAFAVSALLFVSGCGVSPYGILRVSWGEEAGQAAGTLGVRCERWEPWEGVFVHLDRSALRARPDEREGVARHSVRKRAPEMSSSAIRSPASRMVSFMSRCS